MCLSSELVPVLLSTVQEEVNHMVKPSSWPKGWRVRPWQDTDQTAVRNLILAGLAQRFGTADPALTPDLHDIASHYLAHEATFLVAEGAHGIVACGALIHEKGEPNTMRLVRISVLPTHQKQGLGRLVSQLLLAVAQRRGAKRVVLETNSDWHNALRLYKSLGFQEYARTADPHFAYTEVHLAKELPYESN